MRRIKIGDLFEIITPRGKAYFQFVLDNKEVAELIRVLPGIYSAEINDMHNLVMSKEKYLVHFPLKAALKKRIVSFVDNYMLPQNFELPGKMRSEYYDDKGIRGWHIVDYDTWQREFVQKLSKDHISLSPWEVWNDTMLIERLSEGWCLDKWV